MATKGSVVLLVLFCVFLGYCILKLENEVTQLQRNAAIAVLLAEAANNKAGAIAPYFREDKDAFIRAWQDSTNMPLASFPDDVLIPLRQELERKRADPASQKAMQAIFGAGR